MKMIVEDFGVDLDGDGIGDETEHFYEADGYFAAGDPPWSPTPNHATKSKAGFRLQDQHTTARSLMRCMHTKQ